MTCSKCWKETCICDLIPLRTDADRINWMENNLCHASFNNRVMEWVIQINTQVCGCCGKGKTMRDAIDDAMNNEL